MAYFEQTNITNDRGVAVNPATDESIILLRRMVKILESQSATDIGSRQRVTIDAITGSLTLATITSVGTVGTVSAVTGITNALPAGANAIGAITAMAGADQRQFIDVARNTYSNAIRNKLTFS
jgi:hypothetical protein